MTRVIIESLNAWQAAVKSVKDNNVMWCTSSPGLLETLTENDIQVESLEKDLKPEQIDSIGRAAFAFAAKASKYLNRNCRWRRYVSFDLAIGLHLSQLFHVLVYKAWLMARALDKSGGDLICVGDPAVRPPSGLVFLFDRFDTVFAHLADRMDGAVKVLRFVEVRKHLDQLDAWVSQRPMTRWEKLLSIINNTPGAFAFKIWRQSEQRGRIKQVRLYPRPKQHVFFYKHCELIEENFLQLLLRGAQCEHLPALPKPDPQRTELPLPDEDDIKKQMILMAKESAAEQGVEFSSQGEAVFTTCNTLLAERICRVLADLHAQIDSFDAGFRFIGEIVDDGLIISNFSRRCLNGFLASTAVNTVCASLHVSMASL